MNTLNGSNLITADKTLEPAKLNYRQKFTYLGNFKEFMQKQIHPNVFDETCYTNLLFILRIPEKLSRHQLKAF